MVLPLSGTTVLDLTRLLPGNYCCWLLASLGADVIKIEDPGAGDYMRTFGIQVEGQGAAHHLVNRAKRSMVVDLKSPAGRETFLRLVDTADAVVESFRPGVLERLGVGEGVLRERRPRLVVASISGYGADGPLSGRAAHDINALAFSGFLAQLLGPDGLPPTLTTPLADIVGGGLIPALGVMALLVQADRTGVGGWLDASLAEGFSSLPSLVLGDLLAGGQLPGPGPAEVEGQPFYRVYALADGMVAVGAVEPQFWRALCEALGESDLIDAQWDDAARDGIVERLTKRFSAMTRAELTDLLDGRDVCTTVLQTYAEMVTSPHARERDLVRPAVGVPMDVLAPPFRINGARPAETRGAPRQGADTRDVLAERGFSVAEIDSLLAAGAVAQLAEGA
jgi:alpha-methylacyl-CoA racemase